MSKTENKVQTKHNLPPKKTFDVYGSDSHPLLFRIGYKEGGNVPSELSGDYNRKSLAKADIDTYLDKKEKNKSYLDYVRDKENAEIKDEAGV